MRSVKFLPAGLMVLGIIAELSLMSREAAGKACLNAPIQEDDRLVLELEEGSSTAPLIRMLFENGAEVSEARITSASLEESFLALLGEEEQADREVGA